MSRTELGARLNVKEGAVGKYERNDSEPSSINLYKIAQLGGISVEELVTGSSSLHQSKGHGLVTDCHQVEWKSTQLTEDEQELLTMFRKLDPREYGGALRAIELIVETSKYPLRHTEDDDEANG